MSETMQPRMGEEIDSVRLRKLLGGYFDLTDPEIEIAQFPAGNSNLTYAVRVGKAEYVLRRPPFGNTVKTAHDMRREFDVLSKLSVVYAPAPKPLFYSDDIGIIGSEFYLMERRDGVIIRGSMPDSFGNLPNASDEGTESSGQTTRRDPQFQHRAMCHSFIQNLADLHKIDPADAGLNGIGKPAGYCRRQVEGWTNRYFAAKTDEWPELEKVIEWLNNNIPTESGASIVHNDYKFDNIMLDPEDLTRITAVLDWEMVTIGDPLMDLGTTLGYWMSREAGDELLNMPFNPRVLMENITSAELVEMYAAASGRNVSNILFYRVFGTFKIAVIAQQIYARFVKGFTEDERFMRFDIFVAALGSMAWRAVRTKQI